MSNFKPLPAVAFTQAMDLIKQWQQDVADYGVEAYLLYQIKSSENACLIIDATSNAHVDFQIECNNIILRKQLAELSSLLIEKDYE